MFGEGHGILGTWLYTHIGPYLRLGKRRVFEVEDFPEIVECDKPESVLQKTKTVLNEGFFEHTPPTSTWQRLFQQPTYNSLLLWLMLLRIHKKILIPPAICKLLGDLCNFIPILCMKYLLSSLAYEESTGEDDLLWNIRKGYLYASLMFLSSCLVSIFLHQHHSLVIRAGILVKYCFINLLFRQSMDITASSKQKAGGSGRFTTLISTDTEAIEKALWYGNYLWASPLQLVITLVLLFREIQWAVIGGVVTMSLLLLIQARLGKYQSTLRTKALTFTDSRISMLTQLLVGIRIWKINGWERELASRIEETREKELHGIRYTALLSALSSMLAATGPVIITLIVFSIYAAFSNEPLTVSKAFTSLSLFTVLNGPLRMIPLSFVYALNSCAALDRIHEILNATKNPPLRLQQPSKDDDIAIEVKGDFFWDTIQEEESCEEDDSTMVALLEIRDHSTWKLRDVDLKIPAGSLTFITGKIGSGKSTLLHSILGETEREGYVDVKAEDIAFCDQQAWIFNATFRENILFYAEYDEERYQQVIRACALEEDISQLPRGDLTEIGEHGVNLSGGQQARLSLARAVYRNSQVYLLDDIFSAVDGHVAHHILTECILGPLLCNATRVIVTHKLEYLEKADYVAVLGSFDNQSSQILIQGTPKQVRDSEFFAISEADMLQSLESTIQSQPTAPTSIETESTSEEIDSTLIVEEEREVGSVKFTVFWGYLQSFGLVFISIALIILIVQVTSNLTLYWWLSLWATDYYSKDVWYYVQYYAALCSVSVVCSGLFECIWSVGAIFSSRSLHHRTLVQIIRAPISFFSATPIGRMLNRFSHDIAIVDFDISKSFNSLCVRLSAMFGVIVLLCVLVPILLVLVIVVAIIFVYLQRYYSKSSREIRRLDKITKSPIYAFFEEIQTGVSTIRAYNREELLAEKMKELISINQTIVWTSNQINRWLGVRLEVLGAFTCSSVAFTGVLFSNSLGSGYVGLIISQALSLTAALNWTIRIFVELESQLTSVERLLHYINTTPLEEPEEITRQYITPPSDWPWKGAIQFKACTARYREDLPIVLDDFHLEIRPTEKIGICGRTGAGKSSLLLILFRVLELQSGSILIDGIDISRIPLRILRTKALSIIPQSPLLFPGTLRSNLDPLDKKSDSDLWLALEKVMMKDYVSSLKEKLDTVIIEWGDNFSTGQRQLLCLARAILKESRILVLDEATASVDPETDEKIQRTIKDVFRNCTVLTVAHRLSSIIESDRVVVLERGCIKECGPPQILLENASSIFSQMLAVNKISTD